MVDEVIFSIREVDPKKTLQVGSFRVDPNGDQAVKKVLACLNIVSWILSIA